LNWWSTAYVVGGIRGGWGGISPFLNNFECFVVFISSVFLNGWQFRWWRHRPLAADFVLFPFFIYRFNLVPPQFCWFLVENKF
jgi:hypothetical protein